LGVPRLASAVEHIVELFAICAIEDAGKVLYVRNDRISPGTSWSIHRTQVEGILTLPASISLNELLFGASFFEFRRQPSKLRKDLVNKSNFRG
jgi:hypothetical protein